MELYCIHKGEVSSIQPYGVFVKLFGIGRDGLVHKSQMSRSRVDDPNQVASKGDQVYVKVISMEDDGSKVGLSMKAVNQDSGEDLDPNNVQLKLDEQKRKTPSDKRDKRIILEAVLDTTCKKCGGKGHLAQDCFYVPGGTKYDLLPDVDEQTDAQGSVVERKHKKKKKKDHKHKKESRKHKHSDDEETFEVKKRRKHKKKHSSDSGSSDYDEHYHSNKKHKHKKHSR